MRRFRFKAGILDVDLFHHDAARVVMLQRSGRPYWEFVVVIDVVILFPQDESRLAQLIQKMLFPRNPRFGIRSELESHVAFPVGIVVVGPLSCRDLILPPSNCPVIVEFDEAVIQVIPTVR